MELLETMSALFSRREDLEQIYEYAQKYQIERLLSVANTDKDITYFVITKNESAKQDLKEYIENNHLQVVAFESGSSLYFYTSVRRPPGSWGFIKDR